MRVEEGGYGRGEDGGAAEGCEGEAEGRDCVDWGLVWWVERLGVGRRAVAQVWRAMPRKWR